MIIMRCRTASLLLTLVFLSSTCSSQPLHKAKKPQLDPITYLPEVTDKVFLDVEIEGAPGGRITLGLFGDACPKAVENFKSLCQCDRGTGDVTGAELCYRGSTFHKITMNHGIQGGDFSHHDGMGGECVFVGQRFFQDESMEVLHNRPYLLSMANSGRPNTNGSQFFINTVSTMWLDGKNMVFGYVLDGMDVVDAIVANLGTYGGRPKGTVTIVDSGVLPVESSDKVKVPVAAKSSLSL